MLTTRGRSAGNGSDALASSTSGGPTSTSVGASATAPKPASKNKIKPMSSDSSKTPRQSQGVDTQSLNPSQSQGQEPQPSRRWTHFHSALQLAIQRCAHKWTYEDFSECFEEWCKESPDGASGVFSTLSLHMERDITNACDELFVRYNARENIDKLHAVVMEARERKERGEPPGADTWRPKLEPRAAVRARTIPILREEKARLEERLAQLEKGNLELQIRMWEDYSAMKENEAEEARRLDALWQLEKSWSSLPMEDIQEFALRTAETLASQPSE